MTFLLNNKIAAAEILKQYVRVPESYMIKNKGFLTSFDSEHMEYEAAIGTAEGERQAVHQAVRRRKGQRGEYPDL